MQDLLFSWLLSQHVQNKLRRLGTYCRLIRSKQAPYKAYAAISPTRFLIHLRDRIRAKPMPSRTTSSKDNTRYTR